MRILRSPSDLPRDHPAHELAAEILSRIGPGEGHLVLMEPEDRLDPLPWEGVTRHPGYFHAVHVINNGFAISYLIPDSMALRARLDL